MKRLLAIILLTSLVAFAKDHSADYKMGTFLSAEAVADGTITSTLHGDGTTVSGGVYANHVGVYKIKVPDGTWYVTTLSQTQDYMLRNMGMTPMHIKSEKANPLDGLKDGDRVLFRLHERHYLNGKFTLMAIPYADNPNKEVEFSTRFEPDVPLSKTEKPTDNVKAMCQSGKLSAELKVQYCTVKPPISTEQSSSSSQPSSDTQAVLTNQSIVDMVKAGLSDDKIVARIRASKTRFDIYATSKLMQDAPGISMTIIKEMTTSWMSQQ